MSIVNTKKCKDCGSEYPESREYFGQFKNSKNGIVKIGFRNSCRKCMAARTATHSAENPDLVKSRLLRRKKLEEGSIGYFTDSDISRIRIELEDSCRFCGKPLDSKGEIEHLTPLSRGGSNFPKNLTLSCLNCNREKTNKTLTEYLEWRRERGLKNRDVSPMIESPDKPAIDKGRRFY